MRYQRSLPVVMFIAAAVCGSFVDAHAGRRGAAADDYTGYYMLREKPPAGLKAFKALDLTMTEYRRTGSVPIKPQGFVEAGRKYKMTRIDITGAHFSFDTESLSGVSYSFSGDFSPGDDANSLYLSGRLSKTVKRKTVAEATVAFVSVEGD